MAQKEGESGLFYTGDGKSKKTALFFPGATSFPETGRMIWEYIEKNNVMLADEQDDSGRIIEEGEYMYCTYMTENGELWFKCILPGICINE